MRLDIKNLYCPSWNDIQALHGIKRSRVMSDIKNVVYAETLAIPREKRIVVPPIRIIIEAHFKGANRRDPDNLYVKPIIDGMVAAKVIPDDNGEVVESVTLIAKRRQERDSIIIDVIKI
jgi:Holliday junction resolvase RusA-like endonuclease